MTASIQRKTNHIHNARNPQVGGSTSERVVLLIEEGEDKWSRSTSFKKYTADSEPVKGDFTRRTIKAEKQDEYRPVKRAK